MALWKTPHHISSPSPSCTTCPLGGVKNERPTCTNLAQYQNLLLLQSQKQSNVNSFTSNFSCTTPGLNSIITIHLELKAKLRTKMVKNVFEHITDNAGSMSQCHFVYHKSNKDSASKIRSQHLTTREHSLS